MYSILRSILFLCLFLFHFILHSDQQPSKLISWPSNGFYLSVGKMLTDKSWHLHPHRSTEPIPRKRIQRDRRCQAVPRPNAPPPRRVGCLGLTGPSYLNDNNLPPTHTQSHPPWREGSRSAECGKPWLTVPVNQVRGYKCHSSEITAEGSEPWGTTAPEEPVLGAETSGCPEQNEDMKLHVRRNHQIPTTNNEP